MGVTGALMKSAKGLMGQLGMESLANLINLEESTKELKIITDQATTGVTAGSNLSGGGTSRIAASINNTSGSVVC